MLAAIAAFAEAQALAAAVATRGTFVPVAPPAAGFALVLEAQGVPVDAFPEVPALRFQAAADGMAVGSAYRAAYSESPVAVFLVARRPAVVSAAPGAQAVPEDSCCSA